MRAHLDTAQGSVTLNLGSNPQAIATPPYAIDLPNTNGGAYTLTVDPQHGTAQNFQFTIGPKGSDTADAFAMDFEVHVD